MKTPIEPALFRRCKFSGNPPFAPVTYGFIVDLGGPTTHDQRRWLKSHGYRFSGHSWKRADRSPSRDQSRKECR